MKPTTTLNINTINNLPLSIYSLVVRGDEHELLLGCGLWDRENMPHTNRVKNATPGIVLRVGMDDGKIITRSPELPNIVYPLVAIPGGKHFVGCRTGAAFILTDPAQLTVEHVGDFGGGVYGFAHSKSTGTFLIGGRDGTLFGLDENWQPKFTLKLANNRLWNFCLNRSEQILIAASYDKHIYAMHIDRQEVFIEQNLGGGSVTFVEMLQGGILACGCMGKTIKLLAIDEIISSFEVPDPVCFILEHPSGAGIFVTGYRGQIWLMDHVGNILDSFLLDSRENNPIWSMTIWDNQLVAAWANGTIRFFQL